MSVRNIARFVEMLKAVRSEPLRSDDLEDLLGCGRNTIEGYIRELRAHGLIVKTSVVSERSGRAVVAYRLAEEWGGSAP